MAVFRVEKNKDYTVISNFHLRDKNLSLKGKGLLSVILSLPDEWNFTEAGLVAILKESRDSVRSALKELEDNHYLYRTRLRDEKGRLTGTEYVIYENPDQHRAEPMSGNPTLDKPKEEKPLLDTPTEILPKLDKHPQSSTDYLLNTERANTQSINPSDKTTDGKMNGKGQPSSGAEQYRKCRQEIQEQIDYDLFVFKHEKTEAQFEQGQLTEEEYESLCAMYNIQTADRIVMYMCDLLASPGIAAVSINGEFIPREIVKEKLRQITHLQFRAVVTELYANPNIKNPKAYAISMLYNS